MIVIEDGGGRDMRRELELEGERYAWEGEGGGGSI